MDKQLQKISQAYNQTIAQHRQGIDPYKNIPEAIKNTPFFKSLASSSDASGSGAPDIKEYLKPAPGMKFLDAGCSANLYNYRLDRWPSTYYGVDISSELINAMQGFVANQKITIGALFVGDIADLPFEDNFFDIAAVIGVLEYFEMNYIKKALKELNRALKPNARVVLDLPNAGHPYVNDMAALEQHLRCPIWVHSCDELERLITPLFSIERAEYSKVMLKYFLKTTKR